MKLSSSPPFEPFDSHPSTSVFNQEQLEHEGNNISQIYSTTSNLSLNEDPSMHDNAKKGSVSTTFGAITFSWRRQLDEEAVNASYTYKSNWEERVNEIILDFTHLKVRRNDLYADLKKDVLDGFDEDFNEWHNEYIEFQTDLESDSQNTLTKCSQKKIDDLKKEVEKTQEFLSRCWLEVMEVRRSQPDTEVDKIRSQLHALNRTFSYLYLSPLKFSENLKEACFVKFKDEYLEWFDKYTKLQKNVDFNSQDKFNEILERRADEKIIEIQNFLSHSSFAKQ